jgi:hypothetical protein
LRVLGRPARPRAAESVHNLENDLLYQAGATLQTKARVGRSTEARAAIEVDSNLTEDFLWLVRRCGFQHIETLRLALAAMPGYTCLVSIQL